jgi:hypothetical protein
MPAPAALVPSEYAKVMHHHRAHPTVPTEQDRVCQYTELSFQTRTFRGVKAIIPVEALRLANPVDNGTLGVFEPHINRMTAMGQRYGAYCARETMERMLALFLPAKEATCLVTGSSMKNAVLRSVMDSNIPSASEGNKLPQVFVLDWEGRCPIAPQLMPALLCAWLAGSQVSIQNNESYTAVFPLGNTEGFRVVIVYRGRPLMFTKTTAELSRFISTMQSCFYKAPMMTKIGLVLTERAVKAVGRYTTGAFFKSHAYDATNSFFDGNSFRANEFLNLVDFVSGLEDRGESIYSLGWEIVVGKQGEELPDEEPANGF